MNERKKARENSNSSEEQSKLRTGRNASPDAESKWGGSTVYSNNNKAAGSTSSKPAEKAFQVDVNPSEDLGANKLNHQLQELRTIRFKLEEHKFQQKKKKKSPKKKGALKKPGASEFETEFDATSAFTGYTSAMDRHIDDKDRIQVDYFPMQSKPRTFRGPTTTLALLGIENYDKVKQVDALMPKVRDAINFSKQRWGTTNVDRIKRLMRIGIVREISMIEGRKGAQAYQMKDDDTDRDEDFPENMSARMQGSQQSGDASPSKLSMSGRLGSTLAGLTLQPQRARSTDNVRGSSVAVSFDMSSVNQTQIKSAMKKKKKKKQNQSVDQQVIQMMGFSNEMNDEEYLDKRIKFLDRKFKDDMAELASKDPMMQLENQKKEQK